MIPDFKINKRQLLKLTLAALVTPFMRMNNLVAKDLDETPTLQTDARLGINLASIKDWNTELPFVDMFKMSRTWVSQQKGKDWGAGPKLDLDENGWVKRLEENCFANTIICSDSKGHYPSGNYTVFYDGEGELSFDGEYNSFKVVKSLPGKIILKVNQKKGMFIVNIIKTNPNNYLRNIRVIIPGSESEYLNNPWNPSFLKRWAGVACLRMMDFMVTNDSKQISWSNRPKPEDASYAIKGVPVEMLVDLANRLNSEIWFCMPHQAEDDYVKHFARYVKENLNVKLRAWIEYSNEAWNGIFSQNEYMGIQGKLLKLDENVWEAGWKYYSLRSVQIFKIWEDIFEGTKRIVRVLSSQAANSYVSEVIVKYNNAFKNTDVLAIAPYVTLIVQPKNEHGITEEVVSGWNKSQLFDYINKISLPNSIQWIESNKKNTDKYHLNIVCYEAGQHLIGVFGSENNDKVTNLFLEANESPQMGEIYSQFLNAWTSRGGDLICVFNSVSSWSKWGSWGLLQYYDDNPNGSPKYLAVIKWAISRGQKMSI